MFKTLALQNVSHILGMRPVNHSKESGERGVTKGVPLHRKHFNRRESPQRSPRERLWIHRFVLGQADAYEVDDFKLVAIMEFCCRPTVAGDDVEVEFYRYSVCLHG